MRSKKSGAVAVAVVAMGLGAGLATAGPAAADPAAAGSTEAAFLKAVREKGLKVGTGDDAAIDLARSTCAVLARTQSVTNAMRHVQNATEWTDPKDISDFGSLSVQAYCPSSLPK